MDKKEKIEQLYELLRELYPGKVSGCYVYNTDETLIELLVSVRNNAASPVVEHKELVTLNASSQTIDMFPFYEGEDERFITFSFEKNNF